MFRVRHAHDFSSPLRFQVSGIPAELTAEDVHDQLQAGLATRHVTLNESFTFVPARATLRPFVDKRKHAKCFFDVPCQSMEDVLSVVELLKSMCFKSAIGSMVCPQVSMPLLSLASITSAVVNPLEGTIMTDADFIGFIEGAKNKVTEEGQELARQSPAPECIPIIAFLRDTKITTAVPAKKSAKKKEAARRAKKAKEPKQIAKKPVGASVEPPPASSIVPTARAQKAGSEGPGNGNKAPRKPRRPRPTLDK